MPRVGEEITVEPVELVPGGAALARVEGLPVFIHGLYPGDVAVVRITEAKKGFARADPVRLIELSRDRRKAPCPIAAECGGCDWTELALDRQLEAKRGILIDSLRRIGKIDPGSLPPITIHPSPLNYRIRSRLHREGESAGFYAMRSRRVVPLTAACEVVGVATAHDVATGALLPADNEELWEIDGRVIVGNAEVIIRAGSYSWTVSTSSFFQVNRHLLPAIVDLIERHAARTTRRDLAVDLYAGAGFVTLPLAGHFAEVIAVESAPESTKYARINAADNVRVIQQDVDDFLQRMPEADLIFLDPPRAGAGLQLIEAVGRHARERICYLSCDPVTFSRDAKRLIASGWRLASLDLLDLFPNTHHVETFSSFERAG